MTKVKNTALALVSVAALSVPSIGMAQSSMTKAVTGPDSGWYVGGSVGQSAFNTDCTGTTCDDSDTAWRAFGGYMFNKYIGAELGYTDLGKARITGGADLKAKAWDLVAIGVLPIGEKFSVFGKLGMYRADTDLAGASGSSSDNNADTTYAIGAGYDFTKNLGLRLDWQRYSKVGSDTTGGDGDIDVLSIGVVWRFK